MSRKSIANIIKYIGVGALALLVILLGVSIWFYRTPLNDFKQRIAATLPLPVALVNGSPISLHEYNERVNFVQKHGTTTGKQLIKKQVLELLIKEKKLEITASKKRVGLKNEELESELESLKKNDSGFGSFLETKGISQELFANKILRPVVLKSKLEQWFYSQEPLNQSQYDSAKRIVNSLNSGASFGSEAQKYSLDPVTKATQGDSGFMTRDNILPEFKHFFDTAEIGKPVVVASRFGIHVVRILEKDSNGENGEERLHLEQIFLGGADFNNWYKQEAGELSVKVLIKF